MTFVTVFRRVPRPITGTIGMLRTLTLRIRGQSRLARDDRRPRRTVRPLHAQAEVAKRPAVQQICVRRRRPLFAADPGERIGGVPRQLPVEGAAGPRSRTGTCWERSVA